MGGPDFYLPYPSSLSLYLPEVEGHIRVKEFPTEPDWDFSSGPHILVFASAVIFN